MNLTKKLFYLTILVYGLDYFSSYFLHNYTDLIECNFFLRTIFELNNPLILTITFILICSVLYLTGRLFEFVSVKLADKYKHKFSRDFITKIVVSSFYLTFIILESFSIIHNFLLLMGIRL